MIEPMIDPLGQLGGKWSGVFELFCNSIKMLSMHKLESFDRPDCDSTHRIGFGDFEINYVKRYRAAKNTNL